MKADIILADPPWFYQRDDLGLRKDMGGIQYAVMRDEQLYALPVKEIVAKNALLFLWATMPKLPEALECLRSWGFTYSTVAFAWVKLNKSGFTWAQMGNHNNKVMKVTELWGGVYSGLGRWTNQNIEVVLLGKRGTFPRVNKNVKQLLFSPLRGHSEKPDEIYTRIDRLVGVDQYNCVELFVRKEPPKPWLGTGLEYDGRDISDFLAHYSALP